MGRLSVDRLRGLVSVRASVVWEKGASSLDLGSMWTWMRSANWMRSTMRGGLSSKKAFCGGG